MPLCPICARPAQPRPENTAAPFCSPRCRQVDLGQWLDERYRISTAGTDVEDEAPAAAPERA